KTLATVSGSGVTAVKLNLEGQFRLQIEVRTQSPKAKRPRIRLYQWASKAADETIESGDYQWSGEGATYTTQKIYSKLAKISVRGLSARWITPWKTIRSLCRFGRERPMQHALSGS
ncbi:MAG: hypothetical protein KJZ52_09645, partial [Anaerolineales bacterium]|nr:hypothetical protein [Anaerolineales bacterium]